jgi:hypothetical protein
VLTGKLRSVAGILADTDSMHAKMLGEMERERNEHGSSSYRGKSRLGLVVMLASGKKGVS